MKVRANTTYIYYPNLLDRMDGRTNLLPGTVVKVVNLHGCPPANTMGHAHVADPNTGEFIGLVHTNSLHSMSDRALVIAAIEKDLSRMEAQNAVR